MPAKLTIKDFVKRARAIHGSKYDYSLAKYNGSDKKIAIFCHKHQIIFYQKADNHLAGHGCNLCSAEKTYFNKGNPGGRKPQTREEFIKKAQLIYEDHYNYDLVDYVHCNIKVLIRCNIHNITFYQTPTNHLKCYGCVKCWRFQQGLSARSTTEEFIKKAKKTHGENLYDYSLIDYIHSDEKVKIICKKHGIFLQKPAIHLSNKGCPKCVESRGERKVRVYLENNNINYIQEYNIPLTRKYLDFFLLDYNIAIEYHGSQHYIPYSFQNKEIDSALKNYKRVNISDDFKKQWCEDNNVLLLRIHYWEYAQIHKILTWFFNIYMKGIE